MKRILVVTNIPTPYRIPLFNELERQLKHQNVHLRVLFGGQIYRRRKWDVDLSRCKFDYAVLSSRMYQLFGNAERTLFTYDRLIQHIRDFEPHAIIVPGFSIATIKVWLRSWYAPSPYIIWTGSLQARAPSAWQSMQRRVLVRRASGFVAYGTKSKEYLVSLGAQPEDVFIGINTVDTQFFSLETERLRKNEHDPTHDAARRKHLLYVGYLNPRKKTLRLLKAVQRVAEERSDFVLDIIGDGEDRQHLERYAQENELTELVVFHGYKQRKDLPPFLARSACFLFASDYDIWGLVLVEAMAAGLPIIASGQAGAVPDLIWEGVNGFALDFSETEAVADKINWILDHPAEADAMGKRGSAYIAHQVSLEQSAAGFVKAILSVLGRETLPQQPIASASLMMRPYFDHQERG